MLENDLEELGRLTGAADDPEFRVSFAASSAQQAAACRRDHAAHRRRDQRQLSVRRPGEENPRVQAPALELALRRDPLPAHSRESERRLRAAHRDLCRQGGSGLCHGQGHHQTHQQRGAHHRCGPAMHDKLRVVFLPDYDVSLAQRIMRRRICPSRFPRPAWRRREPAI